MISFDLDMTLLDHRTDQITPSALEAIEKLRPKHRIVLAAGRDMDNYYSTSYRDIVRPDARCTRQQKWSFRYPPW